MGCTLEYSPSLGESLDKEKLILKKNRVYYLGSLFFIAGIALLIIGSAFVLYFQIHYRSEPEKILLTTLAMSSGIIFILIGVNLMIKQTKIGYYIILTGAFLSLLGIIIFLNYYIDKWYYPIVGYVLILYIAGFLMLLGNSFAMVTLWLINRKNEYIETDNIVSHEYSEQEILDDNEEATKDSIKAAASQLEFEVFDDLTIHGEKKGAKIRGEITRVKDRIKEVKNLQNALNYGTTDKWGTIGIEKASTQLADTLDQQTEKIRKRVKIGGKILRFGKH